MKKEILLGFVHGAILGLVAHLGSMLTVMTAKLLAEIGGHVAVSIFLWVSEHGWRHSVGF
jgi:hypothetical protein